MNHIYLIISNMDDAPIDQVIPQAIACREEISEIVLDRVNGKEMSLHGTVIRAENQ